MANEGNLETMLDEAAEKAGVGLTPPATEKLEAAAAKGSKLTGKLPTDDPENFVIPGIDTKDKSVLPDFRNTKPLNAERMRDINERGILQPVLIRWVDGKKEIVEGRQRIRHAREINRLRRIDDNPVMVKVPWCVKEGNDRASILNAIAANAHRDGDEPHETARRIIQLSDAGYTEEELAKAYGYTTHNVSFMLRYKKLEDKIQKAVETGELKFTAAMQWAGMSGKKQLEAFDAAKAVPGKITAEVARAAGEMAKRKEAAELQQDTAVEEEADAQDETPPLAGETLVEVQASAGEALNAATTVTPKPATTPKKKATNKKQAEPEAEIIKKPGAVLQRHLIEGWDKDIISAGKLSRDFILAIQWMRGEITAREVPGLAHAIRQLDKKLETEYAKEHGLETSSHKEK